MNILKDFIEVEELLLGSASLRGALPLSRKSVLAKTEANYLLY